MTGPVYQADWKIEFMTRSGHMRVHAFRPTREWAENLARDLNLNNYPKRLYYIMPRGPARPRPRPTLIRLVGELK